MEHNDEISLRNFEAGLYFLTEKSAKQYAQDQRYFNHAMRQQTGKSNDRNTESLSVS